MKNETQLIWQNDPLYPPLLQKIHSAPKRLFWLGQELNPSDRYFAIVGTRHPTPYGKEMAEKFSFALASRGFVIVSGLAYGIDGIAHEAALAAKGRTIAVLGSGLNHIVPTCNIPLSKRIQNAGTLITEYEADFSPHKGTFPRRNRIIAGMSFATLVIEAPEKSGALITARLALEYNREVFALPGNITQETSRGTNQLIRDGKAFPVSSIQDIFDAMELNTSYTLLPAMKNPHPALSESEEKIYSLAKNAPLTVDAIVSRTNLPASQVGTLLSLLELKGLIKISGAYVLITR